MDVSSVCEVVNTGRVHKSEFDDKIQRKPFYDTIVNIFIVVNMEQTIIAISGNFFNGTRSRL